VVRTARACRVSSSKRASVAFSFAGSWPIRDPGMQAAIRDGYARRTENRIASENLSKLDVQAAISAARPTRAERTAITQDRVVQAGARVAFSDIRNLGGDATES